MLRREDTSYKLATMKSLQNMLQENQCIKHFIFVSTFNGIN